MSIVHGTLGFNGLFSFDSMDDKLYYCPLMLDRLPEQIDPFRLANNGQILEGQVNLSQMPRLLPALQRPNGIVDVKLEFGIDEMGLRFVHGWIKTELILTCQRCLQPMSHKIQAELNLGLVSNRDQADRLPTHYDPLLIESQYVSLIEIVEDELLLGLPIVPTHPLQECGIDSKYQNKGQSSKENPFAVLEQLKGKSNKH